jgi:uncharacterized membrane protein YsdA (DUF1294 family)
MLIPLLHQLIVILVFDRFVFVLSDKSSRWQNFYLVDDSRLLLDYLVGGLLGSAVLDEVDLFVEDLGEVGV